MNSTRRNFLSRLGGNVLELLVPGARAAGQKQHTLVCVFLRGGMDALNSVIPHADPNYYDQRAKLAIPEPDDKAGSAIDLDGFFGFHPELEALKVIYDAGDLAVIHAAGAPFVNRSHFDAQKRVEFGDASGSGRSGWMARHLASFNGGDQSPFRALAIGHALPEVLRGTRTASAFNDNNGFELTSNSGFDFSRVLRDLYNDNSRLGQQAIDAFDAVEMLDFFAPGSIDDEGVTPYPNTEFGNALLQAGQYIKSGMGAEVICIDNGGWDHHENLARRLPNKLSDLSASLSAFYQDMNGRMQDITLVAMSEFGRRVKENASAGADHGRGGCMFVMGGGINGGRVYADWPGLAEQQLHQGDLAISTDYRTIFSELLIKRVGNNAIDRVFPGFTFVDGLGVFGDI